MVKSHVDSIIQLLPESEEKIHRLFLSDAIFRELCLEHILCTSQILSLKRGDGDKALIGEYEELQADLEKEILKCIRNA